MTPHIDDRSAEAHNPLSHDAPRNSHPTRLEHHQEALHGPQSVTEQRENDVHDHDRSELRGEASGWLPPDDHVLVEEELSSSSNSLSNQCNLSDGAALPHDPVDVAATFTREFDQQRIQDLEAIAHHDESCQVPENERPSNGFIERYSAWVSAFVGGVNAFISKVQDGEDQSWGENKLSELRRFRECFNKLQDAQAANQYFQNLTAIAEQLKNKSDEQVVRCSICLEDMSIARDPFSREGVAVLACDGSHRCCRGCIDRWFSGGPSKLHCPVCRQDLKSLGKIKYVVEQTPTIAVEHVLWVLKKNLENISGI